MEGTAAGDRQTHTGMSLITGKFGSHSSVSNLSSVRVAARPKTTWLKNGHEKNKEDAT